jgi:hypothetical protein
MAFIGDDHLLVVEQMKNLMDSYMGEAPNLVLLDTSTLADSPAIPRQVRFACDPRYRGTRVMSWRRQRGTATSLE